MYNLHHTVNAGAKVFFMVEQPASISVIIIARNEAIDTLNKLITEVLNQSLTPSEIIFVDTSLNASYREYIDEIRK